MACPANVLDQSRKQIRVHGTANGLDTLDLAHSTPTTLATLSTPPQRLSYIDHQRPVLNRVFAFLETEECDVKGNDGSTLRADWPSLPGYEVQRHLDDVRHADDLLYRSHIHGKNLIAGNKSDKLAGIRILRFKTSSPTCCRTSRSSADSVVIVAEFPVYPDFSLSCGHTPIRRLAVRSAEKAISSMAAASSSAPCDWLLGSSRRIQ